MADPGLTFTLVDPESFDSIPTPALPGARCQTCDYWERLDGSREASESVGAADIKLSRLMARRSPCRRTFSWSTTGRRTCWHWRRSSAG